MLRGRRLVALGRAHSALGARSHVPARALRGDPAGDPSRSKFRRRRRESMWTRLSRSAELTRLTGRLRCGCAGWGAARGPPGFLRGHAPELPAAPSAKDRRSICPRFLLSPTSNSPKGQTSPGRLRESSRAGVCTPLPSPQSSARLNTSRRAGASELRALRKEGHSRPASRGVGGRVSPLRSLPTLVRIRGFL